MHGFLCSSKGTYDYLILDVPEHDRGWLQRAILTKRIIRAQRGTRFMLRRKAWIGACRYDRKRTFCVMRLRIGRLNVALHGDGIGVSTWKGMAHWTGLNGSMGA